MRIEIQGLKKFHRHMYEGHTFKIGQYTRINRLGLGALGKTCLVQEKTTQKYFVIKSFRPMPHTNANLAQYLDRLVSASHPLIHTINAYCLPDAAKKRPLAVVSDYLPGSLASFLGSKPVLTNSERLNMIFGIAEALRHIYSLGLSHRSLVARNVLLTESHEVRVSGFGFGAVMDNVMPSFALDSNQTETESSLDCFCFGLLAWSIFTGEVWEPRNPPRVDERIHPSFQDLITACLDRDYLKRPKFEAIVLGFLRNEFLLPLPEADAGRVSDYRSKVVNPEFTRCCLIRALWQLRALSDSNLLLRDAIGAARRSLASMATTDIFFALNSSHQLASRALWAASEPAPVLSILPGIQHDEEEMLPSAGERPRRLRSRAVAPPRRMSLPMDSPNGHMYDSDPFRGIFAHMTEEACGANPVAIGKVKIFGNSADHARDLAMMNIIDFRWNGSWTSANIPNSWIAFDFRKRQIALWHYTIKTYKCGAGFSHLRSWKVEGSNGPGGWVLLDARNDADDLNEKSAVKTFACTAHDASHVIRITQTGPNHNNDHFLVVTNVEVFGLLL